MNLKCRFRKLAQNTHSALQLLLLRGLLNVAFANIFKRILRKFLLSTTIILANEPVVHFSWVIFIPSFFLKPSHWYVTAAFKNQVLAANQLGQQSGSLRKVSLWSSLWTRLVKGDKRTRHEHLRSPQDKEQRALNETARKQEENTRQNLFKQAG